MNTPKIIWYIEGILIKLLIIIILIILCIVVIIKSIFIHIHYLLHIKIFSFLQNYLDFIISKIDEESE
ncbi:MAG: hypothetical protein ACRC31_02620 [Cetobacterium sp.]